MVTEYRRYNVDDISVTFLEGHVMTPIIVTSISLFPPLYSYTV